MDVSTILKRIELRRIELGMTKTEFYEKSGISSATYSQWNTNTFKPSKRKLIGAASALKMDYEDLIREETRNEKEKPAPETGDGLEEEFIRLFRDLSPEEKVREVAFLRERAAGRDK